MRCLIVAVLGALTAPAAAGEPYWHTRIAIGNDVFSELTPPYDDRGFTNDLAASLGREAGGLTLGGAFRHRWITSTRDPRRWDEVTLFAVGERAWPHQLATAVRIGPSLGGNFGGRWLQNGWHALSDTGPTLGEGLPYDYDGDRRLGLVLGGRARGAIGDRIAGYGAVDGQVALGTGVTSIEAMIGGRASTAHVGAHAELAVTRYHVSDANLALPGGYGAGWQLEWRVGVHVSWSRFSLQYEYRANEGGSGEPIGVIAFRSRR